MKYGIKVRHHYYSDLPEPARQRWLLLDEYICNNSVELNDNTKIIAFKDREKAKSLAKELENANVRYSSDYNFDDSKYESDEYVVIKIPEDLYLKSR